MASPGRSSTNRLRSKTSDISDYLRGRNEPRQPESKPTPHDETPSRGMHMISFFGRRRKSSTVSTDSRTQREGDVPPVPQISAVVQSTSSRPSSSKSSASSPPAHARVPSPLSPGNVSPHSFGPLSQLIHSRSIKRLSGTNAEQKPKAGTSLPVPAVQRLQSQKSTSFEYTRRQSNDSQSTPPSRPANVAARKAPSNTRSSHLTITVSAPPETDDRQDDITPRASHSPQSGPSPPPPPPKNPVRPQRRRAQEAHNSDSSAPPSPLTPVQFPAPSVARTSTSTSSVSSSTGGNRTFSRLRSKLSRERLTQKRASGVPVAASRAAAADAVSDNDGVESAPEPSTRTALPYRPASAASLARAVSTAGKPSAAAARGGSTSPLRRTRLPSATSSIASSGKTPPPALTGLRKVRGGPPTDPLPAPPSSESASASSNSTKRNTDESHSDSGGSMSTMPSIPSVASTRMSVGQVHQLLFRHRTGTAMSLASTSTGSGTLASSGSSPRAGGERESSSPPSLLREQILAESGPVQAARARLSAGTDESYVGAHLTTVEQLREALQAQSAKYQRLTAYLLTLSERHAVEKSELMRRIETLEKEARKREQEITGLRWLVMNAGSSASAAAAKHGNGDANGNGNGNANGNGNGAAAKEGQTPVKPSPAARLRDRMRTSSGSSSGSHKGTRKVASPERALSADSHGDQESIEEGLYEMQQSVSDLIAPMQPSPAMSDAITNPALASAGGRMSVRRSNSRSLSEAANTAKAASSASSASQRRVRQTSSPTLPGDTMGLGISATDLPSIPSLPNSEHGHGVSPTSSTDSAPSIPSLTATNTASSGLSGIPETPTTPGRASMDITDALKDKDPRRRSKRESVVVGPPRPARRHAPASSVSSLSSGSPPTAYAGNLKMSTSPSIGQVLDRAKPSDTEKQRSR